MAAPIGMPCVFLAGSVSVLGVPPRQAVGAAEGDALEMT